MSPSPASTHGVPALEDLGDLSGKSVLVRTDWNVPIVDGVITDDLRITASLPTLQWLADQGAHVTVCTHMGRPAGREVDELAVEPVRRRVNELLPGVEVMENLRFDPGEILNDADFVQRLIAGQDYYVNDAFGVSHRSHASVVGPPQFLPSAAGRLLTREVEVMCGLREHAAKPFVGVLGGAKVSGKLGAIQALLDIVDELVVGGGMCFTFLAAEGHSIGNSLFEPDMVETCRALLDSPAKIHLPTDLTVMDGSGVLFDPGAGGDVRQVGASVPTGWAGYDIGPGTAAAFSDVIAGARTVLWNGPMGVFEDPRFAAGTQTVAEAVAETRAFSVVGGGDSSAAVAQFGLADKIDHLSTGGGASLELLEAGDLPGLAALRGAPNAG